MENKEHPFKISLHQIDSIEFVEEADIPQIQGNLQNSDSSSGSFDLVRDLSEVPDTFLGIIDKGIEDISTQAVAPPEPTLDPSFGKYVKYKHFNKVFKENCSLSQEINTLKNNITKMSTENKTLTKNIAVMKSSITTTDNSAEHQARISACTDAIKRTQKDLKKTEKDLNAQIKNFEEKSLQIRCLYQKIKKEVFSNTDLAEVRLLPEGRRVLKLLDSMEDVMAKDYHYAVKLAHDPQEDNQDTEKEIASIIHAREKLTMTEYQIKNSHWTLGRLMTWKERLEFGKQLKSMNFGTELIDQGNFSNTSIKPKKGKKKNATRSLTKRASMKTMPQKNMTENSSKKLLPTILKKSNKAKEKSKFRRVQSAFISRKKRYWKGISKMG
ncbi:unnamed protein product [Moneuplotes crassus]|uniref:Uncharacterized protein n=1 Tax=Euplotes crassus TaxID=5936 RepID=A0AAD1UED0_EUPCR|nr:unnamed protein product [Moneuplotes crassus]